MKYIVLFERFYNPPKEIKERIDNTVKELLIKYRGGRQFFDALDDYIKDITNQDMMLSLVRGCHNEWICSSGEFGDKLYQLWKQDKFKCKGLVIFNGKMHSLSVDSNVNYWYPPDFNFENKKFLYVDDSYFSGNTVRKINNFLSEKGSSIRSVSVIYDGSKHKSDFVKSFFRYYN